MITFNIDYLFFVLAAIMSLCAIVLVIFIKLVIRREQDIYSQIKLHQDGEAKERESKELLIRYHTVFNSSLLDMIYYDRNGIMRDINETACQSFYITDKQKALKENHRLQDNPLFCNFDIHSIPDTRTTSFLNFDTLNNEEQRNYGKGTIYYESTINPVRDTDGNLKGVYLAGRSVTEMVHSFHRQKEGAEQLRQATERVKEYVTNINNALRLSNIWMVNYYPDRYTMEMASDINRNSLCLSQVRCTRITAPEFRRTTSIYLNRMDHGTRTPINQIIKTVLHDRQGRPVWLMFNLVPMVNKGGQVERYFGMCREMTTMVDTEQRLAVETQRAQETELLKQSFLTNMSYEIRTPLNTVVGFAELFEAEHDENDEAVFVEEIKKNSNTLLQLVNDILFLSRLDARMIEYNYVIVDFAILFEGFCHTAWSIVPPEVHTIVDSPYQRLMVKIDVTNIEIVIQRLCAMALRHTTEGSVHATYEYRHGELSISIEDTGKGVSKEKLETIFDRFSGNTEERINGTGLDLPIVKGLVEQMGGAIEMQSELGKGTTVWVTIPCEAEVIEKKREKTA